MCVFSSPGAQSEFVIVTVSGGQTLTFGGVLAAGLSQFPLHLVDNRHCVWALLDERVFDLNTFSPQSAVGVQTHMNHRRANTDVV